MKQLSPKDRAIQKALGRDPDLVEIVINANVPPGERLAYYEQLADQIARADVRAEARAEKALNPGHGS